MDVTNIFTLNGKLIIIFLMKTPGRICLSKMVKLGPSLDKTRELKLSGDVAHSLLSPLFESAT